MQWQCAIYRGLIWMGVGRCDTGRRDGWHSYLCVSRVLVHTTASSSGLLHVVLQHNLGLSRSQGRAACTFCLIFPVLLLLLLQVSPRANIFRRDQGAVSSLDDMKHLMRYNDYTHDKLSGNHPVASVCSRGDLATSGAVPKGCYDTKVGGDGHQCWCLHGCDR